MSVIVMLADGVRPDTLAGALDAGALPAMNALRARGGLHQITSTFPSVTGPAYAPFLMGRFPGPVGLPGLRWFDRARATCTFPDYTRSYVGYQMRALDRDLASDAPTIFELVPGSVAALSVIQRGLPRQQQLASLTLGSALRAASTHFRGDVRGWLQVDRDVARAVIDRVRADACPYVFAAFTGVDKMSHQEGHAGAGVLEALRIVDDAIAELSEDLVKRGARDASHIWVTSDHGHSSVKHHEDLERLVRDFGYRVMAHPWVYRLAPQVAVMVSGNAMSHLYVDLDQRARPFWPKLQSRWRPLADQILARASVDLMLLPESSGRCLVRSASRGSAAVEHGGYRFSYRQLDGDPLGIGRSFENLSADEAHDATMATDYPDAVVQIALLAGSERAGDIIVSATRDWDFRARYEPIPHVSSHGALHREHMLVPLLLDSRPARRPRRTADVMPSALTALHIRPPRKLDGASFL